jgi:hypothetical protein
MEEEFPTTAVGDATSPVDPALAPLVGTSVAVVVGTDPSVGAGAPGVQEVAGVFAVELLTTCGGVAGPGGTDPSPADAFGPTVPGAFPEGAPYDADEPAPDALGTTTREAERRSSPAAASTASRPPADIERLTLRRS